MWNLLMIMTIMPSLVACNTPINYTNCSKAISSKERLLAVMAVWAYASKNVRDEVCKQNLAADCTAILATAN